MDNRHNIDLRAAIPDTPDMCREAVLHAASTYQEEKAMWRPSKMILAAALIVMLLCGTACAIVNYYSVRDYVADGKTSAAFEENIIPLEKTVTTNGLSFTLGDAVFDGKDLAFTMHLAAEENAAPLYVYPTIEGFCGGQKLNVINDGLDYRYVAGFFLPSADPAYSMGADHGVRAALYEENAVEGDVIWRYTLDIYKPTGELVTVRSWADDSETYEEWMEYLRGLHREGKIGTYYGTGIMDYIDAVDANLEESRTFDQRMKATGLFELVDTVVFEFATAVPEKALLASEQTFEFDDFTLTVKSITQSFLQVDYEMEVVFNEKQAHEHYVEQFYDIFDQNGVELKSRDATLFLAEDKLHCTVWGSVERISDEPLTSLTFVLDPVEWPEGKEIPTFTIDLTK